METARKENQYLYAIKALACLGIIFVHFPLMNFWGGLVTAIMRCCVPVFFIISGMYFRLPADRNNAEQVAACRKKAFGHAAKMTKIYLILLAVYTVYAAVLSGVMGNFSATAILGSIFNIGSIVRLLLLNSLTEYIGGVAFVDFLWYISAAIVVYLLAGLLMKRNGPVMATVGALLLVPGLLLNYSGVLQPSYTVLGMTVTSTNLLRNAWFMGIPFFSIGVLLGLARDKWFSDPSKTQRVIGSLLLNVLVIIGMTMSAYGYFRCTSRELYLGSVVMAVALCALGLVHTKMFLPLLAPIGKYLSADIYYIHAMIGQTLMLLGIFAATVPTMTLALAAALAICGIRRGWRTVLTKGRKLTEINQ